MTQLSLVCAGCSVPLIGALFAVSLLAAGCGAPQAAASQPETAAAAAAIAMADSPQKVTPQEYETEFVNSGAPFQLVDVRTPEEYASGHIAGSVNIPVEELDARKGEISKDEAVVLYCRSGNRSNQAAQILDRAGYTGVYDLGGIIAWQAAGYPVQ